MNFSWQWETKKIRISRRVKKCLWDVVISDNAPVPCAFWETEPCCNNNPQIRGKLAHSRPKCYCHVVFWLVCGFVWCMWFSPSAGWMWFLNALCSCLYCMWVIARLPRPEYVHHIHRSERNISQWHPPQSTERKWSHYTWQVLAAIHTATKPLSFKR